MKFEWDKKKYEDNIKKHGVSFAYAMLAFNDPMCCEYYDYKHSTLNEERLILLGNAGLDVLHISFTELDDETIRIISARKAKKREMETLYYGNG